MKNTIVFTVLLCMMVYAIPAAAQSKSININGRVTSFEESLPLEGVSVQVKNSKNATGTQADGTFSLSLLPEEKILVLYLAGYEKKEVSVTNAGEYNVVLKRSDNIACKEQGTILCTVDKQNEMLK